MRKCGGSGFNRVTALVNGKVKGHFLPAVGVIDLSGTGQLGPDIPIHRLIIYVGVVIHLIRAIPKCEFFHLRSNVIAKFGWVTITIIRRSNGGVIAQQGQLVVKQCLNSSQFRRRCKNGIAVPQKAVHRIADGFSARFLHIRHRGYSVKRTRIPANGLTEEIG